jgi:hypothetical protein
MPFNRFTAHLVCSMNRAHAGSGAAQQRYLTIIAMLAMA